MSPNSAQCDVQLPELPGQKDALMAQPKGQSGVAVARQSRFSYVSLSENMSLSLLLMCVLRSHRQTR